MKITIEPYSGGSWTCSNDAEHIGEVIRMFKGMLVSIGYHPKTVEEHFNDDEEWFPEKDKTDQDD